MKSSPVEWGRNSSSNSNMKGLCWLYYLNVSPSLFLLLLFMQLCISLNCVLYLCWKQTSQHCVSVYVCLHPFSAFDSFQQLNLEAISVPWEDKKHLNLHLSSPYNRYKTDSSRFKTHSSCKSEEAGGLNIHNGSIFCLRQAADTLTPILS